MSKLSRHHLVVSDMHVPSSIALRCLVVFCQPTCCFSFQSSQHRLLIKGGRVVNDDGTMLADVFIEEGIIK